ncbi:hypothetical protein E3T35_06245 [Cryobacterium sp. TMT1-2-2]|uniref:hypothetical protein n=1 Tax=Cryobacterium sp. TMT1-2-2 TaxID=1259233 RepID=UPI001069A50E|nr:hypothetical protein [Cryobacterium sp. TMT1-2-2]TFD12884.1 hypothetical protein E3T35_06245 [Cryobacterium sp. TMT1-2-2]
MTPFASAQDSADGRVGPPVLNDALRQLGEAIDHLAGDSDYIIRALTDMLLAMRPASMKRLTRQQEAFLIESGAFTADELVSTSREVDRGSLLLGAAEVWLSNLFATMSLENVTGFLGWDEDAVRAATSAERLYAIEISGRLRFPVWQFNVGHPDKRIPGLTEVIEVVTPRWDWQSVAGFMATPQPSLVANGRKTPVEWLRDGGDVSAVKQIVEADDWQ